MIAAVDLAVMILEPPLGEDRAPHTQRADIVASVPDDTKRNFSSDGIMNCSSSAELDLARGRRAERRARRGRVHDRRDHVGIRVTQHQRSPRADEVDVAVAVDVIDIGADPALQEDRRAAHSLESAHRGVDAAREELAGSLVQGRRLSALVRHQFDFSPLRPPPLSPPSSPPSSPASSSDSASASSTSSSSPAASSPRSSSASGSLASSARAAATSGATSDSPSLPSPPCGAPSPRPARRSRGGSAGRLACCARWSGCRRPACGSACRRW